MSVGVRGPFPQVSVEAVALPAGQHHVPIQEEHYLALHADVVEPVALSDVQNHEEHHLAMGKFSQV